MFPINPNPLVPLVKVGEGWYDVYIGRNPRYGDPKWGNPFEISKHGNRNEVIEKYRQWIVEQPQLITQLHELNGKILGCHCWPKRCHGEVLLGLLGIDLD